MATATDDYQRTNTATSVFYSVLSVLSVSRQPSMQ